MRSKPQHTTRTRPMIARGLYSLVLMILLAGCGQALPYVNEPLVTSYDNDDPHLYGIVEGMWLPELTCELGVGWERLIFNWREHQPQSPDDWVTFQIDQRWLDAAQACDRQVVALLKDTPQWATDGLAGVGVPSGLDLPLDDPENYWAAFVRRTVEYYAPRGVMHYIIWNEPDIDSDTYGYEFEGDLEDYFVMLKTAYLVAKEVNPDVSIHLAGTTFWHDVNEGRAPYMTRLVDRIQEDPNAAEHGYYFDVLSLHIYFRNDSIPRIVGTMRAMLDDHGLHDKAIWINETNAAPTDDPDWRVVRPVFQLGLDHQAAYVVQAMALGLSAGAERIAVYKLWDQHLPEGGESFGILHPTTQEPRPAYDAWQMVNQHFTDVVRAQRTPTTTADVVRLTHADGTQSILAWARTAQATTVTVTATEQDAEIIDQYGTITRTTPTDGRYRLSLSPALCEAGEGCFLGGEVVILRQAEGAIVVQEIVNNQATTLEFNEE